MVEENLQIATKICLLYLLLRLMPVRSQDEQHIVGLYVEQNETEGAHHLEDCLQIIGNLENGHVNMTDGNGKQTVHFSCNPGYRLVGPPKLLCTTKEQDMFFKPFCKKGCPKPPMVVNGEAIVIGLKDDTEYYSDGVVVEYECEKGHKLVPITSQHRICQHGEWTGSPVSCVFEGCPRPEHIQDGFVVLDRQDVFSMDTVPKDFGYMKNGMKIFYKCNEGYILVGPSLAICQPTGQWQPHSTPMCKLDYHQAGGDMNKCPPPQLSPHVRITEFQETANSNDDGIVIQATCAPGFRDKRLPCEPQMIRCVKGSWEGRMPTCLKVDDCMFPLKIPHGEVESVEGGVGGGRFGIGGQITYNCVQGYQINGEALLTCQTGGCWEPNTMPYCEPQFYLNNSWPDYLNANTSLLFSVVTALSVLFVLLSVCVAVVCRHRPSPHHHHPHPPVPPPALVPPPPDPDRVALIAFADGIQSGLPSYEEAIRSGGGRGLLSYRLHHPPWGQRRTPRGADASHIARQLSSTGESMGSTDTMTVSDVSTTVTLDTVSCHTCSSTSQTASCRAICGSLASFDTSSVLNTEGVPLLEENELEESGAVVGMDANSTPPACDNTSFKLQSDLDSIHS